ncbi:MAG: SecD/SecF family protein translocase subunit, partial [Phycisphaerales bacterium]|nr:SecD/SecF family protein translocase subunit [Phycisphaerales bacterium]
MRHFVRNSCIAIAMLVIAFWSSYPTSETIGLGKDLKGGASLTYAVQINASENANEVIPKVIEVLKRRIDPNGLYEISIVRQGQDRIEITMPLPGEHVVVLKKAFEDELEKLSGTAISEGEFDRVMRMDGESRAAEFGRLSGGSETILKELEEAADAKDESDGVRTQLDLAERSGVGDETLDELAQLAADAEIRYDLLRDQILANAVSPALVRKALDQSTEPKYIRNDQATSEKDRLVKFDSPRDRALGRIRERHPELSDQLDRVVEAFNAYDAKRESLDDASDLKRLVQAAGVLSFRITCDPVGGPDGSTAYVHPQELELRAKLQSKGPRQASARDARWFKINKIDSWYDTVAGYRQLEADPAGYFRGRGYVVEEFEGDYYMLGWDTRSLRMTQADGHWGIANSRQTTDQLGKPAIGFEMNPSGALFLGELTGPNVGANMAVLLDDEVYTAPNLNSRISKQGIIQGDFTIAEINYVVRVLTAGSLQAKLSPEPISENTIAPELGQDNLDAGINAGIWALVIVSGFMIVYYFGYGVVAVICLAVNALLIIGAIALSRASLTLPGIAGIILTFGMAVDANVLIYERIREELEKGLDLRQAVRMGKDKALSSIVDGNVTNLIVCFVL